MVGCGRRPPRVELMIGVVVVVVVVVGAWGAAVGSMVECNTAEYPYNWIGPDEVIDDLAYNTGQRSPQVYSTNYPPGNPYVYGRATCAQLAETDCFDCLSNIGADLESACLDKKGGIVDVGRCMIHYEFYPI